MNETLRISLVQTPLSWQNPGSNRAAMEERIWSLKGKTDLIVLPEMFTTGFTMDPKEHFETMNLHTHKWMRQMAQQTNAAITGSLIIKDGDHYYNRLLFITPQGYEYSYDKINLFFLTGEDIRYTPGSNLLSLSYLGWNIRALICFDLRFPEVSRNNVIDDTLEYDLLLYVANWPSSRIDAWDTLLKARAIENYAYVAAVNRTGTDGKGIDYPGHSSVIDPEGTTLVCSQLKEEIITITLSRKRLEEYRARFPGYLRAR